MVGRFSIQLSTTLFRVWFLAVLAMNTPSLLLVVIYVDVEDMDMWYLCCVRYELTIVEVESYDSGSRKFTIVEAESLC